MTPPSIALPFVFDGPPPPVPPAVISRDASGRATLRAVRLTAPLQFDGRLDEAIYQSVPSISDFIQQEPVAGALATEKTEVWIFFDRENLYISARCWTAHPERLIANDMRRDGSVPRNDNFSISLDTFYDRRHAYDFETSPLGARFDAEVDGDGTSINTSWNGVWDVATGRFDQGWTLEERIPFKSVRYRPGAAQIWGFQVLRSVRWNNERSYITPMPTAYGQIGHLHVSLSATLVGLEVANRLQEPRDQAVRALEPQERRHHRAADFATICTANAASTSSTASRRASRPTSPTTPTSRRWKPTSSR